ncbi:MAG: ATP-binding cassette domain-containing protein [Hydrogenoanaerobacterium sp.]
MSLYVEIRKKLGAFNLEMQFSAENEILALLGASGAGKSVALRCIAGIMTPDEGRIVADGQVLYDSTAGINLPPQQRKVGYLFQQYALFPNMTVRQNIAVAIRDKAKKNILTDEQLRAFHLEAEAEKHPFQLSGGQQQRTALARILASEPALLLLDEPFSALDNYLKFQMEQEISSVLAGFNGTVLWVTHNRGEAWRNCPRVCVVNNGKSTGSQFMTALFDNPETISAAQLTGCKNYTDAVPCGEGVRLPAWNITLCCNRTVPASTTSIGIRIHHIIFADEAAVNSMQCVVTRVIDDVFSTVLLLRPINAVEDAPLLRMEAKKEAWAAQPDKKHVTVAIAPNKILLLHQ